jgi:hypothetical protein
VSREVPFIASFFSENRSGVFFRSNRGTPIIILPTRTNPLPAARPAGVKIHLDRRLVFAESQASSKFHKHRALKIVGGAGATWCLRGGTDGERA